MPRKHKVVFSLVAYRDLEEILDYILIDDPKAAVDMIDNIERSTKRLEGFPELGFTPKDQRLERSGYRVLVVDEYLVFYVIDGDLVRIRRVIHGSRNYAQIL